MRLLGWLGPVLPPIYTACLCFGLDLDEQHRSGFACGLAVYRLEYSRNLVFADGARMQRVFDTVVDRTRSRLDVPKIRTIFGTAHEWKDRCLGRAEGREQPAQGCAGVEREVA